MRVFFDAFFGAFHINYMFQLDMFHHVQVLLSICWYFKNDQILFILGVSGNQQPIEDCSLSWFSFNSYKFSINIKKENETSIEKCLFNCCCFIIHWSRIFSLRKRVHFSINTIILSNVLCASWTCTLAPLITYFVLKNDTWLLLHFSMT